MPPRKSNVSVTSNGAEDGAEGTPAKGSREGMSIEDLTLPKSMIARLAKGVLPANTQIQKDALLALHKSATVFVSYIAANANESVQSSGKKTITPQDMMAALKDCEFAEFLPRVESELHKYNDIQCDKRNTYRRKVKEDKAAAATKDGDSVPKEGEAAPIPTEGAAINGHPGPEAEAEDEDRPVKKFKGEDGSAVPPEADIDDEKMDAEPDVDDINADDDQDDDEDVEDVEEEDDEVPDDTLEDDQEAEDLTGVSAVRDEALDDSGSDSD